jgi:exopolysaccharide biosynthesis polyprenyl glycosylphosphotransferase
MQLSRKKWQLFIFFIDIVILFFSVYLSLLFRNLGHPPLKVLVPHYVTFLPVILAWVVCLYTVGLYSLELPYTGHWTVSRVFFSAVASMIFGFVLYYLDYQAQLVPKTILVLFSFFAFFLILFWRWVFYKITVKFFQKVKITFIGINNTVIDLLKNINNFSYMSYEVPFLFDDTYRGNSCYKIPVIKDISSFVDGIKKNKIKVIVLAYEKNIAHVLQELLFELLHRHIYFINIADFYEIYLRRIPIDAINELWFLRDFSLSTKKLYQLCKRPADILMGVFILILALPFCLLIILIIKLESRGPAFFTQKRVGYLGSEFTVIKFRTMRIESNGFEPTGQNDPRITVFGNFLRKTRIDEIPQLINVLRGEMSFIGPRPERPELVLELEQVVPFYRQRLLVKPGLSGWDQVSGEYHSPSKEDTYKKLQFDLYYIKNMSLFLDISIFFKTLKTVISRAGV